MVMPIALAVFRFTTSSTLAGNWIGSRSGGIQVALALEQGRRSNESEAIDLLQRFERIADLHCSFRMSVSQ